MIIVIGDSYACQWRFSDPNKESVDKTWQEYIKDTERKSWITEVAKYCNDQIEVYGYGGQSWWYSWSQFFKEWIYRLHEIDCIIFCHTHANRINNNWNHQLIKHPPGGEQDSGETLLARQLYYKHIHDEEFSYFAQKSYHVMLAEKFSKIKTIHFTCFGDLPGVDRLPGMVFTTPLMHLSIAGFRGTQKEILSKINSTIESQTHHVNHLSMNNNVALGKFVVDAIENYQPGMYKIDFSKFDVVNPNYSKWPMGKWDCP